MAKPELDDQERVLTVSPKQALLIVPIVFVLSGIFIGVNIAAGSAEIYTGFIFALYWAGVQHHRFEVFPATVGGAFFGLLLALVLNFLTKQFGVVGAVYFLVLIVPIVFFQFVGLFRLLISNASMIFLTVGTIPHVQSHADFKGMFISLGLGVVYLGGLFWALDRLSQVAGKRASEAG